MKAILFSILAATILTAQAQEPAQKPRRICLHSSEITNSRPARDEKSITFTLRSGKVWRNDLRGRCSGLSFNGYSWVMRGDDTACENQQTLRVLQTGSICMLGKFTEVPKAAPKN